MVHALNRYFPVFKRFYLFIFRERRREKERERSISVWLPLMCPQLGTWPTTPACSLTGNRTSNPLLCRPALNPLSDTSQTKFSVLSSFVSCYSLCFKVDFVWYKYYYPSFFLLLFLFARYIFSHPFIFSPCVSFGLKWVSSYPFSHPVKGVLCMKHLIDRYLCHFVYS